MTLKTLIKKILDMSLSDEEIVDKLKELKDNGVTASEIDEETIAFNTFLGIACEHNYYKTVKFLIDMGCDINLKNFFGLTPLMQATQCNNIEIVELLIKNNANVNLKDKFDKTALIRLCDSSNCGQISTMLLLLQNNADITIRDYNGKTAYDYASERGYYATCLVLKSVEENKKIEIYEKSEEEIKEAVKKLSKRLGRI